MQQVWCGLVRSIWKAGTDKKRKRGPPKRDQQRIKNNPLGYAGCSSLNEKIYAIAGETGSAINEQITRFGS